MDDTRGKSVRLVAFLAALLAQFRLCGAGLAGVLLAFLGGLGVCLLRRFAAPSLLFRALLLGHFCLRFAPSERVNVRNGLGARAPVDFAPVGPAAPMRPAAGEHVVGEQVAAPPRRAQFAAVLVEVRIVAAVELEGAGVEPAQQFLCLLYTSPSPRD